MVIQVGDKIGDYEIVELIGSGATGQVFKVRHLVTQRSEALKVLSELVSKDDPRTQRFLREIQVQAGLTHRNIATVHNAFWWQGRLVMVMEFVEGDALSEIMESGPIPLPRALDYVDQALQGLSHAHTHDVVHRDVKPANLIITSDGTVKITDFGLAKRFNQPGLTETGDIMGSLYYISPEQVQAKDIDHRTDLYSMGAVLYELVAGKRPFHVEQSFALLEAHVNDTPSPPSKTNPSLPAELDAIVLTALEKSPQDRFQSADEFREAIGSVRQGMEQLSPLPWSKALWSQAPAKTRHSIMVAASLVVFFFGVLYVTSQRPSKPLPETTPVASLEEAPPDARTYRPSWPENLPDSEEDEPLFGPQPLTSADGPVASAVPERDVTAGAESAAEREALVARPRRPENKADSVPSRKASTPPPPPVEPKESPLRNTAVPPSATPAPAAAAVEPSRYRLLQSLQEPGNVGAVALSPDGKWLVASTEDNNIRIWDSSTGRSLAVLEGHSGRVVSLSVGPEGRLASGSWDGTVKVWDLRTNEAVRTFSHNNEVTAVALSPRGTKLAVALQDKTIRIWDLQTFGGSERLQGHKRAAQGLAFSPNERLLASVSEEKAVQLWRLPFAGERHELRGLDTGATAVSFSPDGRRVAAAGGGRAKVWNVASRDEVMNLGAPGWLHTIIPASKENFLLLGATPDSLRLWDVNQSREVCEIRPNGAAFSIALAASGRRFAAATDSGLISVWETTY